MTPWQIAFFTLQVVFGVVITAFLTMVSGLAKDVRSLDKKINHETARLRDKTSELERKQGVSDAIAEERYKTLNTAVNQGFKNVEKNIEKIYLKIENMGN